MTMPVLSRSMRCALERHAGRGFRSWTDLAEPALRSSPMELLRQSLTRAGLTVAPEPLVYKELTKSLTRVIFPVIGGRIEEGAVVSAVCLYDRTRGDTLYAHPMHAGPRVNPLLKHLDGPMSEPKAQTGRDGDRATRRLIEHKKALWDRFQREQRTLGDEAAGQRWRQRYYWALKRLYFCHRCPGCRWGSPFLDGPKSQAWQPPPTSKPQPPCRSLNAEHAQLVADVLSSCAWNIETAYARRGGFRVLDRPRLIKNIDGVHTMAVFPTDADRIDAGTLVGLSVTYNNATHRTPYAHCLCAGPEPEIQFLYGDSALALPRPQRGERAVRARAAYVAWRKNAWSDFWMDELEGGIDIASARWLRAFWQALERLFGGNELGDAPRDESRESLT